MRKQMVKNDKRRRRRGFTLVEAVVSIAVVTIISAAALTAILATVDITRRSNERNTAAVQSSMIMDCYKTDNFAKALAFCGISGYSEGNFTVYYDDDFEVIGIDKPANNAYCYAISVTVGERSIGVRAILRESGEVLYKTQEWLE